MVRYIFISPKKKQDAAEVGENMVFDAKEDDDAVVN